MNDIDLYYNFAFFNLKFDKYHYTDATAGVDRNYVAYMNKGSAKIVSKHKTIYINEGDVFCIPQNLCYQSYWYGNDEVDFLSFGFKKLFTNESLNFELQLIPCSNRTKDKLKSICTNGANVSCKDAGAFYDAMSDIFPLLTYKAQNKDKILVDKIKNCIRDNYNCSISQIADMCGISEPYLYSVFKKHTNTTPNEFRQNIVCEKAVELLLTTDKKAEDISSMLNFSSSSYFRKVIKKHTGKTPREIRKNAIF